MVAPRQLVVVAHPDAGLRAAPGEITAAAADADALGKLLEQHDATMRPLFGRSEERLRYEAATQESLTGTPTPDLAVFYHVDAADERLDDLAKALLDHEAVDGAYVKPPSDIPQLNDMVPSPGSPPMATPDFTGNQLYLEVAPGGIDARYAWTVPGGRGAGVNIIDIEGAWRFSHEDLVANQGGVIGGMQSNDIRWRNHGTAVQGEVGGDLNTFGVTGICSDANFRAVSVFPTGGGYNSAAAITQAANTLGAGDIILIEQHRPGPRFNFAGRDDQAGYIAIEWWEDDFQAIAYATSRGVIVVEAAGNGQEDLDDAIYSTRPAGFPSTWTNPFNRSNRDSGAIVVGAGAPPPGTHGQNWGADRSRLDFSNYGALIDAQGWGREVTTCGYGDLQGGTNEDLWYTNGFSGTSSASPIVVGAVACVQGVLAARGSARRTPAQMRQLLRDTGSPQQDEPGRPASQRIGNRPDLHRLIDRVTKTILKEKIEAKERKEFKAEKVEKIEKPERKELKEGKEIKLETKEGKLEKERVKELKEGKLEVKERKEFKEKPEKEVFEKDIEGKQFEAGGGLEARLNQLEQTVSQLTHFISPGLRPDLSTGALSEEPDLQKQAKDGKDAEKLSEL